MRVVLADTSYFVAILHPRDGLHERALKVSEQMGQFKMVSGRSR